MKNQVNGGTTRRPALPEKWLVPLRLGIYAVLAACSAFVYFNARDLEGTHLMILVPIVIVCAMALMDCKLSERYWKEQNARKS